MDPLPTGPVTFLFTDVEGSTRLLERLGPAFGSILTRQAELIRAAVLESGGHVFGTEGDALFAVFAAPADAVRAARASQTALAAEVWPAGISLRVRMGVHTGEGTLGGDNYVGLDVHRVARIAASGHGGQIVASGSTREAVDHGPERFAWLDLGEHRLKDLERPERLYQLTADGLIRQFPPLRTVSTRPNNLPVEMTSFIARGTELQTIGSLVRSSRLVTLTGPAGTGKTRLAVETARELLGEFADGVQFVDLSAVGDAELVGPTIGSTLGAIETPGRPLEQVIAETQGGRESLLVVDTFEHLLAGAPFLGRLLALVPRMKAIVTSRAPLRIAGEQEYAVEPFPTPDPRHSESVAETALNPAIQLFVERARAVRPSFELNGANANAVRAIVARLDGLPLAIELGAAWLRVLAPAAIAERLASGLPMLDSGARDRPTRQQTLRGAIAWSYDLLAPPDQALLLRLGIFSGGADLAAVEAVCAPQEELGLDAFTGLATLIDANLVRQVETDHGDPRFRLLETIRDFARDRLSADPGLLDALGRRHVDYVLRVALEREVDLRGAGLATALDRLDHDHDNLRAALRWCLDQGDAETGIRIATAVWRYWQIRGHLTEGRRLVTELLALPAATARTARRADGLTTLGSLAYWQVDAPATTSAYREALDIHRELGDTDRIATALSNLAFGAMLDSDTAEAATLFGESLPIHRESGDTRGLAATLVALGLLAASDAPVEGRAMMAEAEALYRALDDRYWVSQVQIGTSVVERSAGDLGAARARLASAIVMVDDLEDVSATAQIFDQLASVDLAAGHWERAVRLAAAASRLRDEEGAGRPPPAFARVPDIRAGAAAAIGSERVAEAWADGRRLPRAAAAELARQSAAEPTPLLVSPE